MTKTLSVKCDYCGNTFQKLTQYVNENIKLKHKNFCTRSCFNANKNTQIDCLCAQCSNPIKVMQAVFKKSKTKRFYCNSSCAATYNNTHKKHGTRRSKLEIFIENNLKLDFPTLDLLFNDKTAIESEIDVFCPSLRLAVEINGIIHYEPIYGDKVYNRTINRDKQKILICAEKGIELIIINSSKQSYVNDKTCRVYYDEVKNIFTNCQLRILSR